MFKNLESESRWFRRKIKDVWIIGQTEMAIVNRDKLSS